MKKGKQEEKERKKERKEGIHQQGRKKKERMTE